MEGGGGGGAAAAAAAAPSTAPARGASRAALLDQRKKEVQDAAVVGSLVKVVYAEAWASGLLGPGQPCLPATANKFPRRSCATLVAEISRMGSTLPHSKPIVT